MKKTLFSIFIAGMAIQACAQANTELSNLTSPTKVNVNLLPGMNNKYNLGSAAKSWKNLYVKGSLYMNGTRFLASQSGTGIRNTAVGDSVLIANTTGALNTGTGYRALLENTAGSYNSAFGTSALYHNVSGTYNIACGYLSLYNNTAGTSNTALGTYALYGNETGAGNTAIGRATLYYNTTGFSNVAIGIRALYHNIEGHNLVAIGDSALYNNTGVANTAVGTKALYSNTTGSGNTATGYLPLYFNTTGNSNTANGYLALNNNTTGELNTATGSLTLNQNTTGSSNTATGLYALYSNTTGFGNSAYGRDAALNGNSDFCSFFGYGTGQSGSAELINSMALGNSAKVTASNQVRIGTSSVTSIGGYENWTNLSDGRYKKNIKQNVPGLDFINQLKPITYNLDITGVRKFLGEDRSLPENIKVANGRNVAEEQNSKAEALIQKGIAAKEKVVYTGFIAQEVEATAKKLNYDFSGIDKPQDENGLYGLRYAEFVVPLVKAVQELSAENNELKKRLEKLEALRSANNSVLNTQSVKSITSLNAGGYLEQNIPNPFNKTTIITTVYLESIHRQKLSLQIKMVKQ